MILYDPTPIAKIKTRLRGKLNLKWFCSSKLIKYLNNTTSINLAEMSINKSLYMQKSNQLANCMY
jgi:hypothetical protein